MRKQILLNPGLPLKRMFSKVLTLGAVLFITLYSSTVYAIAKTAIASGNWSDGTIWSPSGVPANADDITIKSGYTVTVDGNYTCNNLAIGNGNASNTVLQISSSANSLTINGALQINPSNKAADFKLDAGPGAINVAGTFTTWSTSGTDSIKVGAGSITFTPAVTINAATNVIMFTGAGTVTFNGAFADKYNKLITYTGCTVNFGSTYTVNTTSANWNSKGTAIFTGAASSITPTSAITFNDVQVAASKTLTLNAGSTVTISGSVTLGSSSSFTVASGSGTFTPNGSFTLGSGSTFTSNKDFTLTGNWTNNGGTFNGSTNTVTLNATAGTIGGTSSTTFYNLIVGSSSTAATVSCTLNSSVTCNNLTFHGGTLSRTLAQSSGTTLTINGDLTINQPTITAKTNLLDVGAGTCTVAGNLNMAGASSTSGKNDKINVTTGSFNVAGSVSWMTNTLSTTEVIAVSTGTVTFGSSVSMLTGSATIQATGAGTLNFNGTTGKSLVFGGLIAPVLSTSSGTTVNFANGFQEVGTAPSFASGTSVNSGSASNPADIDIDPTLGFTNSGTAVIYGNLTASSAASYVNAANATLEVRGSISSNITLTATAAGNTVKYSGTSAQTIKPTSYVNLTAANAAGISTSSWDPLESTCRHASLSIL